MSDVFSDWFVEIVPDDKEWMDGIPPPPSPPPSAEALVEDTKKPEEHLTSEMQEGRHPPRAGRDRIAEDLVWENYLPFKILGSRLDWDNKKKLEKEAQSAIEPERMVVDKTLLLRPQDGIKR
ncbi:unnamed protein product [Clonostachys rosea f. rosea IK726]|nr:unnamed protein product [Clonostachys rosea f. rosea IK726]